MWWVTKVSKEGYMWWVTKEGYMWWVTKVRQGGVYVVGY